MQSSIRAACTRWSEAHEAVTTPSEELVQIARRNIGANIYESDLATVHYRGGQTEFDLGRKYALSDDPLDRCTGANILGKLGWDEGTFHDESVDLLLQLVTDNHLQVVVAAAYALGHRHTPRGIPNLLPLIEHPDEPVRFAALSGLTGLEEPAAIEALVRLTRDKADQVRDWAVFGLGSMIEVDTPQIRDALFAVLDDPYRQVRGEAMTGLAVRHDPRVLPVLIRELEGEFHDTWCVEAAEAMADPQLLPLLVKMRVSLSPKNAAEFGRRFDDAIRACSGGQ